MLEKKVRCDSHYDAEFQLVSLRALLIAASPRKEGKDEKYPRIEHRVEISEKIDQLM